MSSVHCLRGSTEHRAPDYELSRVHLTQPAAQALTAHTHTHASQNCNRNNKCIQPDSLPPLSVRSSLMNGLSFTLVLSGTVLRWGRGHVLPQIHLLPPDSKASSPFWRDFWGPKMLPKFNFSELCPGLRWGSLQHSPRPSSWWGGGSLAPLKNPTPALGPSGLVSIRVSGSNPLQIWQPY